MAIKLLIPSISWEADIHNIWGKLYGNLHILHIVDEPIVALLERIREIYYSITKNNNNKHKDDVSVAYIEYIAAGGNMH